MARRRIPGEFVPLDVHYMRDERVRRAGSTAELLFIRSLTHVRVHNTSGFIADFDLNVLGYGLRKAREAAGYLVREGLWIDTEGGWQIRSWEKWNGANSQDSESRSLGGTIGSHNRWHLARGEIDPGCSLCAGMTSQSLVTSLGSLRVEEEEEREENSPSDADASDDGPAFSDDVIRLCDLLAELVRGNGHKVTKVGLSWHQACERLFRIDGYTPEQVEWIIRWATADEFWAANIRSMPTLRDKFSTLKARATSNRNSNGRPTPTTTNLEPWMLR
jgi:hypothetical protein